MKQNTQKDKFGKTTFISKRKLAGLFIAALLILVGILVRMTILNTQKGEAYTKTVLSQSQSQYTNAAIPFKRGDILDINGNVLATSQKVYNLILDCYVNNTDEDYYEPTVNALVSYFEVDENEVRKLLSDAETKESRYQILLDNVSIDQKQAFEAYLNETEGITEEEAAYRSKVKGVWFEEKYKRYYPFEEVACDVIGFTNYGNTADWGIEGYYSEALNGVDGRKYGYFNSSEDLQQTIIEPENGNSAVSTLDVNIQMIAENCIQDFEEQVNVSSNGTPGAENIGVLIMNPNDGSILAMASNNSYDLNNPRDLTNYYTSEQIANMSDDQRLEALNEIWRNYCVSDTYEPGSTFKPITMAAALENGSITGSETYFCDGSEEVAGTTIKCSDADGHGEETVSDVIKNSCNDGMMKIASLLGIDEFSRYQSVFNFGSKTGIDLPGEASGILHSSSTMGDVDLATSSFGQGFTCTMVQEAAAICSVINGGNYYRPRIVDRFLDENGSTVKTMEPVLEKRTVSQGVSDQVRSYMIASVEEGTSAKSKVNGYSSCGKTGTAQKIPRGNGKYLVSFIGSWPAESPQVLIYVVVDEPNVSDQANSAYAQVLAKNIMRDVLPYMNIYPDEEERSDYVDYTYSMIMEMGAETMADTNVPEVQNEAENVTGGNTATSDGYTNEQAGFAE